MAESTADDETASRPVVVPQVLVVGAGPVGLFMSASLARLGIAVRIVDKAPEPSDKSKAVVMVLKNAGRMTRVALLKAPWLQRLRDLAVATASRLPGFERRLTGELSEIDLYYAESPLNGPSIGSTAGLHAGDPAGGGDRLSHRLACLT